MTPLMLSIITASILIVIATTFTLHVKKTVKAQRDQINETQD